MSAATRAHAAHPPARLERDDAEALAAAQRHRLFDLTGRFHAGNLVTRTADGMLQARPMTVALIDSSSEEIGFLTIDGSDSVRDVTRDPMVSLVFQDGRHHVTWSGRAYVETERYRILRAWQPEHARWCPNGPEDPHLVLLVVRAIRAEYWSASVVTRALRVLGASNATLVEADLDPMRHGVVVFGDEGAITEW